MVQEGSVFQVLLLAFYVDLPLFGYNKEVKNTHSDSKRFFPGKLETPAQLQNLALRRNRCTHEESVAHQLSLTLLLILLTLKSIKDLWRIMLQLPLRLSPGRQAERKAEVTASDLITNRSYLSEKGENFGKLTQTNNYI